METTSEKIKNLEDIFYRLSQQEVLSQSKDKRVPPDVAEFERLRAKGKLPEGEFLAFKDNGKCVYGGFDYAEAQKALDGPGRIFQREPW